MKVMLNQQGYANVLLEEATSEVEVSNKAEIVINSEAATTVEAEAVIGGEGTNEGEAITEGETAIEGEATTEGETAIEGEAITEGDAAIEGEATSEGEIISEDAMNNVDMGGKFDESYMSGDAMMGMDGSTTKSSGSLMSNWLFVIGISSATLVISIVLAILLAKKRIKKGFDLYED